jgi:neopullulanase
VYVYFRYDDNQTVMCIMNTQEKTMTVDPARFAEIIKSATLGKEVTTGASISLKDKVNIPGRYVMVLELK